LPAARRQRNERTSEGPPTRYRPEECSAFAVRGVQRVSRPDSINPATESIKAQEDDKKSKAALHKAGVCIIDREGGLDVCVQGSNKMRFIAERHQGFLLHNRRVVADGGC
jgi:hypothetical protein